MEITITLSEEDQSLQAEILKVLLKEPQAGATTKTAKRAKKGSQKTPAEEPTETPTEEPTEEPTETPKGSTDPTTQPNPETPSEEPAGTSSAPSMEDLRKSVNAISRKKGLNWLYTWLGDLGVKSIAEIPADRLEEAKTKLQNYA